MGHEDNFAAKHALALDYRITHHRHYPHLDLLLKERLFRDLSLFLYPAHHSHGVFLSPVRGLFHRLSRMDLPWARLAVRASGYPALCVEYCVLLHLRLPWCRDLRLLQPAAAGTEIPRDL